MNFTHLSSRASVASTATLRASAPSPSARVGAPAARPVECAINRAKKEEIVGRIRTKLDDSMLLFGMRFSKMPVTQMEGIRRTLPRETTIMVAKNSLMRIATDTDEYSKWASIEKCTTRDNIWVMVPEENIAETVKCLSKITKAINKEYKANKETGPFVEISGGVMEGKFLEENDVMKLENMPTKLDLITKTAVGVKMVPTKLARGVKAVPQKLVRAVKQLSDEENPDREALVGDVFPKPE